MVQKLSKTARTAKKKQLYADIVQPSELKRPPARLNIDASDLPAIKDWDVGETYDLSLKAKMISKSEGGWDGKQPLSATFEVSKASDDSQDSEED